MLEKTSNLMGKLAGIAAVIMVILFILSRFDWSFLFEPKTYIAEYVPGIYMTDGYVSPFLKYKFTAPEGYELATVEERAVLSNVAVNGLTVSEMEERMKKQSMILDLYVYVPLSQKPHAMVLVEFKEEISKKDLESTAKELLNQSTRLGMKVSGDYKIAECLDRECAVYTGYRNVDGVNVNQDYYVLRKMVILG